MTFEELEREKQRARDKKLSFAEQCTQMGKYILANKVKTVKRSDKNVKTTTRK